MWIGMIFCIFDVLESENDLVIVNKFETFEQQQHQYIKLYCLRAQRPSIEYIIIIQRTTIDFKVL